MNFSIPFKSGIRSVNWEKFFSIYREPIVTFCITPNNSPIRDNGRNSPFNRGRKGKDRFPHSFMDNDMDEVFDDAVTSDMLLNTITGLFSKFYLPERIRLSKRGVRVKLNDVVSYKVVFQNGAMKFFLTVPEKWAKNFTNAVKRDWGSVDINQISTDVIELDPKKCKAMNIVLRHHHALSIKHQKEGRDILYSSLSSLGSTLSKEDKLVLDFNILPLANSWKDDAVKEFRKIKKTGKYSARKETSFANILHAVLGVADSLLGEVETIVSDLTSGDTKKEDKENKQEERKFSYTDEKLQANSNGFQMQTRVIVESDDSKKCKHILKNVQSTFEQLDGDNKFVVKSIRTKRGIKTVIKSVIENKPLPMYGKDIFFEKEMNQLVKVPSRQTLKEYKKLIDQDNFTRTEIPEGFFKDEVGAIPFAKTLDKDSRVLHMPTYEREDWTNNGRKVKSEDKPKLDDRCNETLAFGGKGSGKTELSMRQALTTFLAGADVSVEEWKKKSKSVVFFDVADGEVLVKLWNRIPTWLRHRVKILNHSIAERPVPVNFSDLEEFNVNYLQDPDFASTLAELEANLITDVLKVDKSMAVERWFKFALQCVHFASPDWGIPEAIKMLVDDDFRKNEVMPKIVEDLELLLEMEVYNDMSGKGEHSKVVTTINNRLNQIRGERHLWDCIAQKPLRNEDGSTAINFRKWCDGDEDGAYLVLIFVPNFGRSDKFRRFLFAHYFTKLWNVALSREKGFAAREYRPETLVIVDEIHQIIDVDVVANIFLRLFKEARKYSFRFWFTLHGWSSLKKAGGGLQGALKESIMEVGCNLIMLRGGKDAFESLEEFMGDLTVQDFENLMNMEYCGIFSLRWNGHHVFQARMLPTIEKTMPKYDDWSLNDLAKYVSPYSRERKEIREENLKRIANLIKTSIQSESTNTGSVPANEANWEDDEED